MRRGAAATESFGLRGPEQEVDMPRLLTNLRANTVRDEWASQHNFSSLVHTGELRRWMTDAASE